MSNVAEIETKESETKEEPDHDQHDDYLEFFSQARLYFTALKEGGGIPPWFGCQEQIECKGCPWMEPCYDDMESLYAKAYDILKDSSEGTMPNKALQRGIMEKYGCMTPDDYQFTEMPEEFQEWVQASLGFIMNTAPEVFGPSDSLD